MPSLRRLLNRVLSTISAITKVHCVYRHHHSLPIPKLDVSGILFPLLFIAASNKDKEPHDAQTGIVQGDSRTQGQAVPMPNLCDHGQVVSSAAKAYYGRLENHPEYGLQHRMTRIENPLPN